MVKGEVLACAVEDRRHSMLYYLHEMEAGNRQGKPALVLLVLSMGVL
jgi:hypothetical protein